MWDLIVSVPDHCLSFYFDKPVLVWCITNNQTVFGLLSTNG